jgi:hypothetical protein
MADDLNDVERQVLSAVRDEGLPTNSVALTQRTGLDHDVVKQALAQLGRDHLATEPRDDGHSQRTEVVGFKGDGALPRDPTTDAPAG